MSAFLFSSSIFSPLVLLYSVPLFMQHWLHFMMPSAPPLSVCLKPALLTQLCYSVPWCCLHWQISGDGSHEVDTVRQPLSSTACKKGLNIPRHAVTISVFYQNAYLSVWTFPVYAHEISACSTSSMFKWWLKNWINIMPWTRLLQCPISGYRGSGDFPDQSLSQQNFLSF